MLLRSWSRVLLAPEGDPAGAGSEEQPPKRSANAAAVDQIHNLDDRVSRLEGGFFDRIASALKPASSTPPNPDGTKAQAAPKKSVIDELGECMDPFGFF